MFDFSWILTFLVGFVVWFLARQWMAVRALPPGPYPLPIVGNILRFRSANMSDVINGLRRRYGGIFTIWMGSKPFVYVNDYYLIREALIDKKTDFAGRMQIPALAEMFVENMGVTGPDYSKPWEMVRRMSHAAIRKYALNKNLPPVIDEITDDFVQKILKQNKPFNPKSHLQLTILNIMASTVFGQKYKEDDDDVVKIRQTLQVVENFGNGFLAVIIPLLRPFFRRNVSDLVQAFKNLFDILEIKIKDHMATYQSNDIRDIVDSLLNAREEIIAELGPENATHLNDRNILHVIMDIFGAGIDTSVSTIRWMLIYVTKYPEIQDKIIQEIRDNIGERVPTQDDKKRCPFTMAVLMETMRLQMVAPYGLPHKTLRDTEIGGRVIPKDTVVMFHFGAVHHNPNFWKDPEKFMPERFLDSDGKLTEVRPVHFIPFSMGRRSCIGEKLAIENIFMVVVGLFRRCRLTMIEPPVDMETQLPLFQVPKHFTLRATHLN